MIGISQWRESHCRTNTSVRRKKEIQKSRTVRITVRDASRKVSHLSKVIWDRKIKIRRKGRKKTFNDCLSSKTLFQILVSYFSWSFITQTNIFITRTEIFRLKFFGLIFSVLTKNHTAKQSELWKAIFRFCWDN